MKGKILQILLYWMIGSASLAWADSHLSTSIPAYLNKNKPKPTKVIASTHHRVIIVIDPGHGGKDPGSIGIHGAEEKNIVLDIAKRLAALINKQLHMRAVLTRSNDNFIKLRKRLAVAHKAKADIFIAIHADAYMTTQSSGVSVYALSPYGASSEAARWLAQRENVSELAGANLHSLGRDNNNALRSVLLNLSQTATNNDSLRLGTALLAELNKVSHLHSSKIEQAPFRVLKSPDVPSILVETGYLSNSEDEDHLQDKAYRDKLAHALLEGIHRYAVEANLI